MARYLLIVCVMVIASSNLAAQERTIPRSPTRYSENDEIPALHPEREQIPETYPDAALFNLQNVSLAKASPDGASLVIKRPTYEKERRARQTVRQVARLETRTRTVKTYGEDAEQEYTVKVLAPIYETEEIEVLKRAGSMKFTVPLSQVKAWTLAGEAIETADLVKRLQQATAVIALECDLATKREPIDPFFGGVFRKDALVIHVAPGLLTIVEDDSASPPTHDEPVVPRTREVIDEEEVIRPRSNTIETPIPTRPRINAEELPGRSIPRF